MGRVGRAPRLPITEEEREALRMKGMDANAQSAVHALDLRSRRALGDAMRRVSSAAGGPGRRADASVALNAARKEMLDAVRERSKGKKDAAARRRARMSSRLWIWRRSSWLARTRSRSCAKVSAETAGRAGRDGGSLGRR